MPRPISNAIGEVITSAPGRAIVALKFSDHGRTGKSTSAIREVQCGVGPGKSKAEEDPAGRGIWVDDKILVPWSNLNWVQYE